MRTLPRAKGTKTSTTGAKNPHGKTLRRRADPNVTAVPSSPLGHTLQMTTPKTPFAARNSRSARQKSRFTPLFGPICSPCSRPLGTFWPKDLLTAHHPSTITHHFGCLFHPSTPYLPMAEQADAKRVVGGASLRKTSRENTNFRKKRSTRKRCLRTPALNLRAIAKQPIMIAELKGKKANLHPLF